MPEHTALAVSFCTFLGRYNRLADSKVLVIASQNFDLLCAVVAKKNKVFQDVQESLSLENTLKKSIELGKLVILVAAVLGLPFHIAVFAGGNGTGLGGHHIAHNANAVINKHTGDFLHIVTNLLISLRCICFFPGGALQFHKNHRDTIQENQQIRALNAVLFKGPLIGDDEGVVVRILEICQFDQRSSFLTIFPVPTFDSVLQVFRKYVVLVHQIGNFKIANLFQCLHNSCIGRTGIDLPDTILQNVIIKRALKVPFYIRAINMGIPHILK